MDNHDMLMKVDKFAPEKCTMGNIKQKENEVERKNILFS